MSLHVVLKSQVREFIRGFSRADETSAGGRTWWSLVKFHAIYPEFQNPKTFLYIEIRAVEL